MYALAIYYVCANNPWWTKSHHRRCRCPCLRSPIKSMWRRQRRKALTSWRGYIIVSVQLLYRWVYDNAFANALRIYPPIFLYIISKFILIHHVVLFYRILRVQKCIQFSNSSLANKRMMIFVSLIIISVLISGKFISIFPPHPQTKSNNKYIYIY